MGFHSKGLHNKNDGNINSILQAFTHNDEHKNSVTSVDWGASDLPTK
jgi:hypothetical protein